MDFSTKAFQQKLLQKLLHFQAKTQFNFNILTLIAKHWPISFALSLYALILTLTEWNKIFEVWNYFLLSSAGGAEALLPDYGRAGGPASPPHDLGVHVHVLQPEAAQAEVQLQGDRQS